MQRVKLILFQCPLLLFILLQACAYSCVQRNSAHQIDVGVEKASYNLEHLGDGGLQDAFDNTSQTAKGAIIGGATGAVAGGLTSGVGVLPGAGAGAIFGGAIGAYIDAHTTLVDKLRNRGVKIMVLGDQIKVIIFSDHIFDGMSSRIKGPAYPTLNYVADFLRGFTKMSVQVAGYTSSAGSARINQAVSQEQANSVAKYLWLKRINARVLTAVGYGGSRPVEDICLDNGMAESYRIEITTEKLPVC